MAQKSKTKSTGSYIVTGGPEGTSSIEVDGRRYSPGEQVDLGKDDHWLLEQGYVAEPDGSPQPVAAAPPAVEEIEGTSDEPAPADEEGEG